MKKIVCILFVLVAAMMMNSVCTEAKSCKRGNFLIEYEVEGEDVWITKITPRSKKGIETLKIPKKLEGKKVVKLGGYGDEEGDNNDSDDTHNLFGVFISEDDDSPHPIDLLEKVKKIKTIRIPSSVKVITNYCFKHIQDGKNINIPNIEEPLDGDERMVKESLIKQFTEVKWNQITASPKNEMFRVENGCLLSRDGKNLYGFVQKRSQIVIPGTVKRITVGGDYKSYLVNVQHIRTISRGEIELYDGTVIKVTRSYKEEVMYQ